MVQPRGPAHRLVPALQCFGIGRLRARQQQQALAAAVRIAQVEHPPGHGALALAHQRQQLEVAEAAPHRGFGCGGAGGRSGLGRVQDMTRQGLLDWTAGPAAAMVAICGAKQGLFAGRTASRPCALAGPRPTRKRAVVSESSCNGGVMPRASEVSTMSSELIKHVSDVSFDSDVIQVRQAGAGGLLGRMVRPLQDASRRSWTKSRRTTTAACRSPR